ncbi:MAG: sulfatase-like hydrolase/transferase [Candidatus Merdivicinus sp.]|jgi:choline-sulfatase
MKKPNILFLMCDEHRADLTGYAGNKIIRTPNLDRLAETGVVFQNAYTPAPICVPARQCMMAGQYPKTCHCEIWKDLEPGYMTFARQFSRYAYNTTACGKLHHLGEDQMQGWTTRIGMEAHVAPKNIENKDQESFDRYARPFADYKWDQVKEIKRATIGYGEPRDGDDYAVDGAIRYIKRYYNDPWHDREMVNTPLMLKVSLLKPHYPYTADEDLFMYYLNRVEPYYEDATFDHPALQLHRVRPDIDVSKREIRRATAVYYAMVEESDRQFGKIMQTLEEVGQNLDDWIIVYTADHGEMLGQHGLWEKQKFYEGSVRVPLIIRWPKYFQHRVVKENVNLCDLFATLCEMADIPTPDGLDSRSLVPLMKGDNSEWVNETFSQFEGRHFMMKWNDIKYQYYGKDLPEMLFDLKKNPGETIDYINDPEYADIVQMCRKRREEMGY